MWKSLNVNKIIKNPFILKLAESYYNNNMIQYLKIEKKSNKVYHVEGDVKNIRGSHHVFFEIDNNMNIKHDKSDCEDYCVSFAAILYKLKNTDIQDYPYIYQQDYLSDLIKRRNEKLEKNIRNKIEFYSPYTKKMISSSKDYYDNKMKSALSNQIYMVETVFEADDESMRIGFKVGTDKKKYVLKNINDFLNRIEHNEYYEYGKNFGFVHTVSAFDDDTKELIQLLKKLNDYHYKQISDEYYYGNINKYLVRYVDVDSGNLDMIFNYYKDAKLENVEFNEAYKRIPLEIVKGKYAYKLTLKNENDYYVTDKYVYKVYKDRVHHSYLRYMSDDEGKLRNLIHELCHQPLYINHDDYYHFYKYVLTPIMDYLDLELPVDVQQTNYTDIQIYGDIDEEARVVFKIYYVNEENDRILGFNKDIFTTFKQDIVEKYFETHADFIDYENHVAYFDVEKEKTMEFILEGLNFLIDYGHVFVSEALKRIGKTQNYSLTAGVRISNDLLSVNLESNQIPKDEIANILNQYRKKKKYYRLKNGDFIFLNTPEIEELDQFVSQYHVDIKDIKNGQFDISKNKMFAIDNSDMEYIKIERNSTFEKVLDDFYNNEHSKIAILDTYDNVLRNYQVDGVKWMMTLNQYGFNGILADDMGLGKTLQVIAMLDSLPKNKPSLVICPASLIYNWEDEVHKFSQSLRVQCVTGNKDARMAILMNSDSYDLLVTSYDYMKRDFEFYENKEFNYVILDEAQYIKNHQTKNAQTVKKIKADHRLALTGTPIENTLAELWSIFDFLMPDYLYNYHYFRSYFENDIVKSNLDVKVKKLRQMVSPFILRRTKKDVLKELPDKIEKTRYIPFSEEESKIYFASLAQANEELQTILHMENVNKVQILALLMRLRQLCCEPRMVYENIVNTSSKLKSAIEIIDNAVQNKQQVLLFSTFRQSLDYIAEELSVHNISFKMLTGSTSKEKRREFVEAFQNDEFSVFLISLKAGGTGLNLTNAEVVIHFDPWWNISVQNQATDRAHRIGQKKNVQVYKLVMKDSIEEKIVDLQSKKKDLADMFVENNDGHISSMSKDEIVELFKM